MTSERLDVALVRRGLARSRTAAAAAVVAGAVLVDGAAATRPSQRVRDADAIDVTAGDVWVGRAAGKLAPALAAFGVAPDGRTALDLGASTGGFTQVLLEGGARLVVALDVGHGQLAPALRLDPRVVVVEGENARSLTAERWAVVARGADRPDLVVADLSFISLRLVLPAVAAVAHEAADLVLLVKPQFEVGRGRARGGVVRDPQDRADAVLGVVRAAAELGLRTAGVVPSAVAGEHGNRELLVHLHRTRGSDPAEWEGPVGQLVRGPDGESG